MVLGSSNSVYMANSTEEDIYVMVSLNPDWIIADLITDIDLFLTAIGEIAQLVTGVVLPTTIATLRDLHQFLKISYTALGEETVASTEAALAIHNAIKKNSIVIPAGQYKQVNEKNWLELLFNASGVGSLLGASIVSLMVMTGDGKRFAMYDTKSDYSWIATNDGKCVRSKYGSVWQQDPQAGVVYWPLGGNQIEN
ncbi:hypothetical protein E1B28_009373 [Marasmius oreades]|uniref:Uncharacterized protein n=1 Tax=Marasmius oreades TaxID=181124 RepID=A0A9P7S0Z1_9AGAR|nr:uncharacterized protein E1B28_009373 [Marasmius oreades]KAG7093085.1 hypothetical protein E1B28_009373 [Marasmius oreades]